MTNGAETQERQRRVLIYDPGYGGHHLRYVALLVRAFHARGWSVAFASQPAAFTSEEYAMFLAAEAGRFHAIPLTGYRHLAGLRGRWLKTRHLLTLLRAEATDLIFLPFLDDLFWSYGLARFWTGRGQCQPPADGILFFCGFAHAGKHLSVRERLKAWVTRRILRAGVFRRVLLLDEVAHAALRDVGGMTRVEWCPDPADVPAPNVDVATVRRRLGLPLDGRVLGVFGLLNEGKGVDRLARAFVEAAPAPDCRLLLLGRQSAGLRATIRALEERDPRLVVVDRWVPREELLAAISAVDVVAVPYPRHPGSASFLVQAVASGKPVLGANWGWIGHVIRRYGLGMACDILDPEQLRAGVAWSFTNPRADAAGARDFAAAHTPERFQAAVLGEAAAG